MGKWLGRDLSPEQMLLLLSMILTKCVLLSSFSAVRMCTLCTKFDGSGSFLCSLGSADPAIEFLALLRTLFRPFGACPHSLEVAWEGLLEGQLPGD